MNIDDMFPSNWIQQKDVPQPIATTIRSITQSEVNDNGLKKMKNVLQFGRADLKPMILNKGVGLVLAALYGSDSSAWIGKPIEIYVDPTVQMGGKIVGGLRLRLPTNAGAFQNGSAPTATWFISDGKSVEKRASIDEVRAHLMELLDLGIEPGTRRVKGPDGAVMDGAAWMMANAGQQQKESPIPF